MSREKFVKLCIDRLEPETAKGVLKAIAEEMPVAGECLYQMFHDDEIKVRIWPQEVVVVPPRIEA